MTPEQLQGLVDALIKAGADAGEAAFSERSALSVTVRNGALDEVEREESRDLGLRAFIGRRQASVSGSDTSAAGCAKLIERVVAMARLAPDDPYAGLAPADRLFRGAKPDLQLYDPTELTPAALEDMALAAEAAAMGVAGVTLSNGASASQSGGVWRLATSSGFVGDHRGSVFGLSAQVIAGEGAGMEQGYDGRAARWRADLIGPERIGAEAGRRATAALGPRKLDSMTAHVVFENRVAGSLFGPLIGAISGPAVARGVSFLKDRLGQAILPRGVSLTDNPHRPRGLASAPFDDEGVANRPWKLIDDGVLTTWLLNTSAARQLGLETTGHASRGLAGPPGVGVTNVDLTPGEQDLAGLLRQAGRGVFVTSMFGPSLNSNTGDWSVGCSGHWFENGEIAYPVSEITVAGNLLDLYARLIPGSDIDRTTSAWLPSLFIPDMAIAGR